VGMNSYVLSVWRLRGAAKRSVCDNQLTFLHFNTTYMSAKQHLRTVEGQSEYNPFTLTSHIRFSFKEFTEHHNMCLQCERL
jgi:hypothetical protein